MRLLHRTTRKLHLTDAGATFHDWSRVRSPTSTKRRARPPISSVSSVAFIRLTAPLDLGVWAVASIVARFVRRHPTVNVEVRLSSRVVDLVAEGFDLAVRAGPVRDESLIARRTGALELALYASSRYVARRGAPKTLEELQDHDCIVLRTDTGTMSWKLTSRSGTERTVEPRGAISADDISFIKKAVLAGEASRSCRRSSSLEKRRRASS